MNPLEKLKDKARSISNDPILVGKEKVFIKKMVKIVPDFLKMVTQVLISIYIFRKLGENLGFLEAITIELAIILVILRGFSAKKT